ncbi:MAG: hypothetical protein ABIA75_15135 [Candidatus Neomarinimicrobiota bacterium]
MKQILVFSLLVSLAAAQFKNDVPRVDFPAELENLQSADSGSLFDPSRFQMQHGFSMSMSSFGGQSFGVGAYTNYMSFLLRDNLRLTTNFSLIQPSMLSGVEAANRLDGQVGYGAQLQYQPRPNLLLEVGFQTYPRYLSYNRPWNLDSGLR